MPYPGGPARPERRGVGSLPVLPRRTPRACSPSAGSTAAGCRKWFNVLRDTVSYRIAAVYRLDDAPPDPAWRSHVSTQPRRLSRGRPHRPLDRAVVHRRRPVLSSGIPVTPLASALLAAGRDRRRPLHLSRPAARHRRRRRRGAQRPGQCSSPRPVASPSRCCRPPSSSSSTGSTPSYLSGVGELDPTDDTLVYDKKYVHTDVLVIGGGPAGLAAAREAAGTGARVILIDDQPELGGSLLSEPTADGRTGCPPQEWLGRVESRAPAAAPRSPSSPAPAPSATTTPTT